MPSATERNSLLRKPLEQFTRTLHGVEEGNVRALHRARVASRRLREVLPVLQLDRDVVRKLNRRLRKVTSRLGSVRELDVLMLLIDELHESNRYNADALNRIAASVDKERKVRRARMATKMPVTAMSKLARKLDAVGRKLETNDKRLKQPGRPARGWRWAADARLAHRAEKLQQAVEGAGSMYLPDRLHDVRIALKKFRYSLEVVAESTGARRDGDLRAFRRAQDVLGRLHDLQTLIDRARQTQASLAPPNLITWRGLESLVLALEDDCRRLHARFMHARPDLLARIARLTGQAGIAPRRRVTA